MSVSRWTHRFGSLRESGHVMFWKILAAIVVVWVVASVVGAVLGALFPLLMLAVIVTGLYFLFRAVSGSRREKDPVNLRY